MKSVHVFLCALFLSASSLVSAAESCPSVDNVTLREGVYTAPSHRAGDEWIAVSSALSPSRLTSFEGAVFYPLNNQQGTAGRIGYCEYKAQDRSRINLLYRQSTANEHSMRLANIDSWTMIESGVGLIVYECTAANAGACAFSVLD